MTNVKGATTTLIKVKLLSSIQYFSPMFNLLGSTWGLSKLGAVSLFWYLEVGCFLLSGGAPLVSAVGFSLGGRAPFSAVRFSLGGRTPFSAVGFSLGRRAPFFAVGFSLGGRVGFSLGGGAPFSAVRFSLGGRVPFSAVGFSSWVEEFLSLQLGFPWVEELLSLQLGFPWAKELLLLQLFWLGGFLLLQVIYFYHEVQHHSMDFC